MHDQLTLTYGLCECGCGQQTRIASTTNNRDGHVKGEPFRFINGHAPRGRKLSPEHCAKIGDRFRGVPKSPEQRQKMSEAASRERNAHWTGGVITREGRTLIHVGRQHPMADVYGYVYEHRLVASQAIGRHLVHAEFVHHIDEDPQNNTPENLAILSNSAHRRLHNLRVAGYGQNEALAEVGGRPCA